MASNFLPELDARKSLITPMDRYLAKKLPLKGIWTDKEFFELRLNENCIPCYRKYYSSPEFRTISVDGIQLSRSLRGDPVVNKPKSSKSIKKIQSTDVTEPSEMKPCNYVVISSTETEHSSRRTERFRKISTLGKEDISKHIPNYSESIILKIIVYKALYKSLRAFFQRLSGKLTAPFHKKLQSAVSTALSISEVQKTWISSKSPYEKPKVKKRNEIINNKMLKNYSKINDECFYSHESIQKSQNLKSNSSETTPPSLKASKQINEDEDEDEDVLQLFPTQESDTLLSGFGRVLNTGEPETSVRKKNSNRVEILRKISPRQFNLNLPTDYSVLSDTYCDKYKHEILDEKTDVCNTGKLNMLHQVQTKQNFKEQEEPKSIIPSSYNKIPTEATPSEFDLTFPIDYSAPSNKDCRTSSKTNETLEQNSSVSFTNKTPTKATPSKFDLNFLIDFLTYNNKYCRIFTSSETSKTLESNPSVTFHESSNSCTDLTCNKQTDTSNISEMNIQHTVQIKQDIKKPEMTMLNTAVDSLKVAKKWGILDVETVPTQQNSYGNLPSDSLEVRDNYFSSSRERCESLKLNSPENSSKSLRNVHSNSKEDYQRNNFTSGIKHHSSNIKKFQTIENKQPKLDKIVEWDSTIKTELPNKLLMMEALSSQAFLSQQHLKNLCDESATSITDSTETDESENESDDSDEYYDCLKAAISILKSLSLNISNSFNDAIENVIASVRITEQEIHLNQQNNFEKVSSYSSITTPSFFHNSSGDRILVNKQVMRKNQSLCLEHRIQLKELTEHLLTKCEKYSSRSFCKIKLIWNKFKKILKECKKQEKLCKKDLSHLSSSYKEITGFQYASGQLSNLLFLIIKNETFMETFKLAKYLFVQHEQKQQHKIH
ncbi:hypothetical protein NPIL_630011 [Nephila pilipes]|uniref:Uncharacterized protein n=1 Tax=Nephila pilipes TaxID=299642 RepID=A0A8X6QY40_NEPPI|nr:hypothetical protein NPIL_630011 [Nephila pilipes]